MFEGFVMTSFKTTVVHSTVSTLFYRDKSMQSSQQIHLTEPRTLGKAYIVSWRKRLFNLYKLYIPISMDKHIILSSIARLSVSTLISEQSWC